MEFLQDPAVVGGIVVGIAVIGVSWYVMFSRKGGNSSDDSIKGRGSSFDSSKYPGGKLHVYFGSQTGTAEGFARVVLEEGRERGFDVKLCDLEDFEPQEFKEPKLAMFIVATYGEGEPTDNARRMCTWLKPAAEADGMDTAQDGELSEMKFCVFGLGNKQYEHYNRMGKTTNANLERLGGERVATYGEGDDDGNLEEDFNQWREQMWPQLIERFIGSSAAIPLKNSGPPKKVTLQFQARTMSVSEAANATKSGPVYRTNQIQASTKHFFEPHSALATLTVNRELRNVTSSVAKAMLKEGGKAALEVGSTRHLEIDISNTGIAYETADNLAILPENSAQSVETFAAAMGYDLQEVFTIEPVGSEDMEEKKFKYNFPVPCTIRQALTCYVDFCGSPRLTTVAQLIPYVASAQQRAWLEALVAKDAHAQFKQYMHDNGKSLFDLLTSELNSCKIPLADMLHILPSMQPRYYTISSSSSVYPKTVHLTLSITEFLLPSGRNFKGLTSSYIKNATMGQKLRVFVRPSSFRLPKKNAVPIVMIGPGTGIAPMRALIQERRYRSTKGEATSKDTLYFGCKNVDLDYLYREELEEAQRTGLVLHTAFSRQQKSKVYVQHLMADPTNAKAMIADLDAGAYVYVCGATAMGADVHQAFIQLMQDHKGMSKAAATTFLVELQKKGRYVQELWSA